MSLKMRHCQTCGYEETSLDLLVCCSQCEEIIVHRYCMDGPVRFGDEEVVWLCDDCSPRFVKHLIAEQHIEDSNKVLQLESKILDIASVEVKLEGVAIVSIPQMPEVKSEDIGLESQRGLVSSLKHGFDTITSRNHEKDIMLDTKPKSSVLSHPRDCLESSSLKQLGNSLGCPIYAPPKIESINERGGGGIFDQSINHEPSNSQMLASRNGVPNNEPKVKNKCGAFAHKDKSLVDNHPSSPPTLERSSSLLKSDSSWRGICRVTNGMHTRMPFELKAHLSSNASFNVAKAVQTLPMPLDLELVHKSYNWPKRFNELPPSGEDIGLYFFPMQESDVKHCAALLEKMFDDDLVLKFTRNDLKLLLFTSFDLPKEIMSLNGKCYLWGVFSSSTSSSSTNVSPTLTLMEQQHPCINKLSSQDVSSANFEKCGHERDDKCQCIPIFGHALPSSSPSNIKHGTISSRHSTGLDGLQQVIGSQAICALQAISPFNKRKQKHGHNVSKEKRVPFSYDKISPSKGKLDVQAHDQKKNKFSSKMRPMKRSGKSQAWRGQWVESNLNHMPHESLPQLPNQARFAKKNKRYYRKKSNVNSRPNESLPPLLNRAKFSSSKRRSQTYY